MSDDRRAMLRQLPAIDKILASPQVQTVEKDYPHVVLRDAAQSTVEALRQQLLDEHAPLPDLHLEAVVRQTIDRTIRLYRPSLRRVINVTGTVLHTNLGRAPLCDSALQAVNEIASGYSNLEYNLDAGERGKRYAHVEQLICRLTGGEAATVVNNNAGAVLLALTALARNRNALVSRGEMIEIGGAFRIPDVMAAGGVKLVEVGTTNKTHLADYAMAITQDTALILKVHTSNYRILGFTESVSGEQLAGLAREHDIPVLEDLGSGLLMDLTAQGLPREPTVRDVLKTGIDLVTFSGDKLLGGPQAGIIVGRGEFIDVLRKHPMARALRIDKLTLAALEATLRYYLNPQQAMREIPALKMLTISAEELQRRCKNLLSSLKKVCRGQAELAIIEATSTVGGGALPLTELPGWVISVIPMDISLNTLISRLRQCDPAVVGRVQDHRLLIDPRTLKVNDEEHLKAGLQRALNAGQM